MSAVRIINREDWEKILTQEHNCKKLGDNLETGEFWLTPNGKTFVVPVDLDGILQSTDLQLVLVEIAKLRPLDWDT